MKTEDLVLVGLLSFWAYVGFILEVRARRWLTTSRMRLSVLQLSLEEVKTLNSEVVALAKEKGLNIKETSEQPEYRDLGKPRGLLVILFKWIAGKYDL